MRASWSSGSSALSRAAPLSDAANAWAAAVLLVGADVARPEADCAMDGRVDTTATAAAPRTSTEVTTRARMRGARILLRSGRVGNRQPTTGGRRAAQKESGRTACAIRPPGTFADAGA